MAAYQVMSLEQFRNHIFPFHLSQYRLGERPPYRRSSPFRHISVLTSYRAQVEAFSEFCDALQLEKHAILLVLPAQRIELLHFSGRSSPFRAVPIPGLSTSFQWVSRIWKPIICFGNDPRKKGHETI